MKQISNFLFLFCILFPEALPAQQVNELTGKLAKAANDSEMIAAYRSLIKYYATVNADSQNRYVTEGLDYCRKNRYKAGEAAIIGQLAVIDDEQGRVALAWQRTEYALGIYTELGNMKGVAEMHYNEGTIEASKGNYDVAIKYFIIALKIYDTITDFHGQMMAYMNLGSLYLQHQDTTNTWKYLRMADKISHKTPLSSATIFLYNIIGVMYAQSGKLDTALQIFKRDLELSNKKEFASAHVECLLYIGEFYIDKQDVPMAMKYEEEGLKTARENNLPEMEANFLVDIARAKEKDNIDSALAILYEARALCEKVQSKSFLSNVYNEIAAVYERNGKYKEALAATKKKQNIVDSMFSMNKAREIESIGAIYELEKSNIKISQLENKSKEDALEMKIIMAVSSFVILILIVLLLLYRRTIVLNKKLVAREQELEELNATKDKLFSIIGHDLRGPVARIPQILDMYDDEDTTDDEKKALLDGLREHAKISADTLDKLLLWGQSVLKGVKVRQENIVAKTYVDANVELKKLRAGVKQIAIKNNVAARLTVHVMPSHFDFIIRNLLDNAIKYTRAGGLVEINADTTLKPGYTVFAVKDNGIGIRPGELAGIFKPLTSAEGTAQEKGTGIGLMLCKEFAVQNGGDLWVESEEGSGSTFFLSVKNAAA